MVLKEDGSVWATGCNEYGQLGDGSIVDRMNYTQVVSSGVKSIAAGRRHSMILKQDGSVWATGNNLYGQIGAGPATHSNVFVQVLNDGVKAVAAGYYHNMVLKQDGSVWVTGSNKFGQLGDGSTENKNVFDKLAPFDNGSIIYHTQIHALLRSAIAWARSITCCTLSLFFSLRCTLSRTHFLPTCLAIFFMLHRSLVNWLISAIRTKVSLTSHALPGQQSTVGIYRKENFIRLSASSAF